MSRNASKRDFLAISDLSREELLRVLDLAARMKAGAWAERPLQGKALAMVFAKSSTRTRVSFEVGALQLGGHALFLSSRDIQLGRGEPIRDTARVLSRLVDGIMIRTFAHEDVEELARFASVPVINGLTDLVHPCQVLADLLTVRECVGPDLERLRVAWVGDGNNMANSWLNAAARLGFELRLACPEGYRPDPAILERARAAAPVLLTADPREAVDGADVVNTDVWASMGQEEEAADRARVFQGYRVDEALMARASAHAIFLHCLPAHRGEEVDEAVLEGPRSRVFDEAENRLHVQKAVMAMTIGRRSSVIRRLRTDDRRLTTDDRRLTTPRTTTGLARMTTNLKRTPLYDEHVALNGKIVPFAGYEMPVQYPSGITAEHHAVRKAAGLFDVSHMGEFEVRGERALDFVQHVTTNDASRIEVGQAQYSALLNDEGKLLDDLLVYRFPDRYLLVVNGANREKDWAWVSRFADRFGVELVDRSDDIALLALQGPKAESILQRLTAADLPAIRYYRFAEGEVDGRTAVISRTGYTGEDGFEIYLRAGDAAHVWRRLLEVGAGDGILPAGLGCRDSLRLEMGYALYGNDLDEGRTPLEAGLGWVTKLDKGEFVGRDAVARQKEAGVERRLVGFRLLERGFPRHGYRVRCEGEETGEVTSGIVSPSLGEGIGMAYVPVSCAKPGSRIEIVIRDQPIPAEVVRPPFYKQGTVKS